MPLISVIVPVYKVEPYLHQCVDSILNQTFKDFELILVDDGSPDNCPAICDEYAKQDNRVKVIHKENAGVSSARNAGLDYVFANSNSEYISFVDGDDYIDILYFEKAVDQFELHNADMVRHNFICVDTQRNRSSKFFNYQESLVHLDTGEKRNEYIETIIITGKLAYSVWISIFKRSIIEKNNIRFSDDTDFAEDFLFLTKYCLFSKIICFSNDTIYYYVQRNDSCMSKSLDVIRINDMNKLSKNFFKWYDNERIEKDELLLLCVHYHLVANQLYKSINYGLSGFLTFRRSLKQISDKKFFVTNNRYVLKMIKKRSFLYDITEKQLIYFKYSCNNNMVLFFIRIFYFIIKNKIIQLFHAAH